MSDEQMSNDEAARLLEADLADGLLCGVTAENSLYAQAIRAAIAALGGGWLPIESAPKDGSCFLTYSPDTDPLFTVDVAYWIEDEECFGKVCCGFDRVTHWKPMPSPPATPTNDR